MQGLSKFTVQLSQEA